MRDKVIHERDGLRIEDSDVIKCHDVFYRGEQVAFLQRGVLRDLVNTPDTKYFKEMFERVQPVSGLFEQIPADEVYHFLAQARIKEEERYANAMSANQRVIREGISKLVGELRREREVYGKITK